MTSLSVEVDTSGAVVVAAASRVSEVSSGQNSELYNVLAHEKPVIHNIGE